MMKVKFTEEERNNIQTIIDRYRTVSDEISDFKKKSEEIQNKVNELQDEMKNIKSDEDTLMKELHQKYGEFNLQDVYDNII